MTIEQTLFDPEDLAATPAGELPPKPLRELLFAGLILSLEDAIERERPAFDEREYMFNPDGSARSGTPYWQAWYRAGGMQSVLYMVRNALATHEEYLIAERERINASWSQREIECARHRDVCPRCMETSQRAWSNRREIERAERVATSFLDGILQVQIDIDRAAEGGHQPSAAQISKALGKVIKTAKRLQQSGEAAR